MTTETSDRGADDAPSPVTEALLVYAEPLLAGAHAVVVGGVPHAFSERLLELGARSVQLLDPDPERAAEAARTAPRGVTVRVLAGDIDVRGGAFDVALVPDLAILAEPRAAVARLRHGVGPRGSVVAMGRARVADGDDAPAPFSSELGPARLEYGELYELFSAEFEDVSVVGVVPFEGVVFAELGVDDEAADVSVDTRLAEGAGPSVFVVVAGAERASLDPYAIVKVPSARAVVPPEAALALEQAIEDAALHAEALSSQVDELRHELVARELVAAAHLERAGMERDGALTRAMELEAVLAASQQAIGAMEQRLLEAERDALGRDDRAAMLTHELAHVAEAHAAELNALEAQLAERARVVGGLEAELLRREELVKELVTALEEAREGAPPAHVFEAPPPVSAPAREADPALVEEVTRLRRKLDELAAEVARREGELTARAWRIQELEGERARAAGPAEAEDALRRALDEVDALRSALAQEHAARVAAESGEELARARSELARQAVLLEQVRGRAHGA